MMCGSGAFASLLRRVSEVDEAVEARNNVAVAVAGEKGVQADEVSSSSLYIQQNICLYQQLTKEDTHEIVVPMSPVEKLSIQERWGALPSPFESLKKSCLIPASFNAMPNRMKTLSNFGFYPRKNLTATPRVSPRASPVRTVGRLSPYRRNINARKKPSVLKAPKNDTTLQTFLTKWTSSSASSNDASQQGQVQGLDVAFKSDISQNSALPLSEVQVLTPFQQMQRQVLVTAYTCMEEENMRTRLAVQGLFNVNEEYARKIEGLRLILSCANLNMLNSPQAQGMILQLFGTYKGVGFPQAAGINTVPDLPHPYVFGKFQQHNGVQQDLLQKLQLQQPSFGIMQQFHQHQPTKASEYKANEIPANAGKVIVTLPLEHQSHQPDEQQRQSALPFNSS